MLSESGGNIAMFQLNYYETEKGNAPLSSYLESLVEKHDEKSLILIKLYIEKLREYGNEINIHFKENASRKESDGLYELRPGKHRVFFFFWHKGEIVLLHAFHKKSKRTPKNELDTALKEMQDYRRRYG